MKFIVFVSLLLTGCTAAVSYNTPAGQQAKIQWAINIPVVKTQK